MICSCGEPAFLFKEGSIYKFRSDSTTETAEMLREVCKGRKTINGTEVLMTEKVTKKACPVGV